MTEIKLTKRYPNSRTEDITDAYMRGWNDALDAVQNGKFHIAEQTEPQTERIKTLDYCDICNHKGCDNCIANSLDDYCVPSGYEPTTQTETQNSNMTFEKRTMLDCYNCKRFETEDECIECRYEPKDEPQTDCDHKCIQTEIGCEKPDCPWT